MASIKRHGAPTRSTKGRVGQTYHDLDSGLTYKCISAYSDTNGNGDYHWQVLDIIESCEPVPEELDEPMTMDEIENPTLDEEEVEEPVKPAPQQERRNNYGKPYNKHQYNKPNRN